MNRRLGLLLGALASIGIAELYHGPLGAAAELRGREERYARNLLDYYELPQISARMADAPLRRRLILKGPADDFQRKELVRQIGQLPGVNEVVWDPSSPIVDYWAEKRKRAR